MSAIIFPSTQNFLSCKLFQDFFCFSLFGKCWEGVNGNSGSILFLIQ